MLLLRNNNANFSSSHLWSRLQGQHARDLIQGVSGTSQPSAADLHDYPVRHGAYTGSKGLLLMRSHRRLKHLGALKHVHVAILMPQAHSLALDGCC